MNIDYTKKDDSSALIEVTVEPQDYLETFDSELKGYQKKVNLKGFRKGKTPKSMIRKMYGNSVLVDVVVKKMQDALHEYLKDENLNILGDPIPAEDQELLDIRATKEDSYTFKYEVGLAPEFEIGGLEDAYHYYDTIISQDEVDKQIDNLRRNQGSREAVENDFGEEDIISFNAWELEEGEIKEDGLETTFEVMVDMMDEDIKDQVLKAAVGDTIDFDIFKIEKKASEDTVRKYLLNLEEDEIDKEVNPLFRGEIVGATRLVLAEMDEEFLTTAFGEEVKTVDDARDVIAKDIKGHYDEQADSLTYQEVHDKMMADTNLVLPDEFLKRWMAHRDENNKEEGRLTTEEIENAYNNEFRESLKWQLISEKLIKKYDISVEQDEILAELGRRIQQYMPGQQLNQEVYNQILQSLAQDQQQVQSAHSQIRVAKIFKSLKPDLNLDKEEISQESFDEKLKKIAESRMKEQAAGVASEEE